MKKSKTEKHLQLGIKNYRKIPTIIIRALFKKFTCRKLCIYHFDKYLTCISKTKFSFTNSLNNAFMTLLSMTQKHVKHLKIWWQQS